MGSDVKVGNEHSRTIAKYEQLRPCVDRVPDYRVRPKPHDRRCHNTVSVFLTQSVGVSAEHH